MAIPSRPRNTNRFISPRWRSRLRLAGFKGQPFYVDQQGRSSGRRTVVHEYPKRDMPYTEDMGRHAMRYQITGYLVQAPRDPQGTGPEHEMYHGMFRDYDLARDNLERVLCEPSPGPLNDPYNPGFILQGYSSQPLFMCERYTIVEQRERGGFCSIEMSFVEAGAAAGAGVPTDTAGQVLIAANAAMAAAASAMNAAQQRINRPGADLKTALAAETGQ
ncbi:MAG: hypothetical protein C5B54_07300 [Acidobacteria bacterium]|nr:MAG: hypothetical protein C5B54_07300 [Acidobacteriota bacterium]